MSVSVEEAKHIVQLHERIQELAKIDEQLKDIRDSSHELADCIRLESFPSCADMFPDEKDSVVYVKKLMVSAVYAEFSKMLDEKREELWAAQGINPKQVVEDSVS